ncbi:copper chaperone PCu(A)C [Stenotrophomonas sp. C3(2023)]|uniref:copper chaperone PCu(A)C n=1 Tax=Stenotrophomonas sp. C3(2023) TaxID=3080277 RepID=UPI00293C7566|nr:copper chaperone PCu(A)C [Stenotrophomonas sp. C3(2023)]MDV3469246.1 copper chaperone PCu(A)C [Stenotrophomonas sp. C3(2023)]
MITKPFVGVLLMLCAGSASAVQVDCVKVSDGWARLPPGAASMTAGYMTLRNECPDAVRIVGARSAQFADVSVHETTLNDGVSRMQHVHEVPLARGASVEFKPGGLHLMLMQPVAPLQPAQQLQVTLQLHDGGEVRVPLAVRGSAR